MSLCVLIPARNEELGIGGTIRSILDAGVLPSDVYLVDDGSTDYTGEIARSLGATVLRNEQNLGKAAAVRKATDHFSLEQRYDFLSLMDADTRVNSSYFAKIAETFQANPDAGLVFGRVKNFAHNYITAYRCLCYAYGQWVFKDAQSRWHVVTVAPGCSSTYRTSAFAKLEWSKDTITEDMDCTIQFNRKKLGKVVYQKDAIVYTQDPQTLRDYVKQIYRWDTGTWQVGRKHRMWQGVSPIDWEFKMLMSEGLFFSLLFMLLPLWMCLWKSAWWAVPIDMAVLFISSLVCAVTEGRVDAALYAPLAIILRITDCAVFLYSFIETVIIGRKVHGWFAVKRYAGGAVKYTWLAILLFASAAHGQDNSIILPQRTFAPSPGSAWLVMDGGESPIEHNNGLVTAHFEQGRVIVQANKVNVELYVSSTASMDTQRLYWNNRVALQGGVKVNRTFSFKHAEGVASVGTAYAYENRYLAGGSSATAPGAFASDWFGWQPAEEKESRWPGETWAEVGTISPVEGRGQVIGTGYVQQGYKLPLYAHEAQGRRMDWSIVPFVESTYSKDRYHYDWNNFERVGAGVEAVMAPGVAFGASYVNERRFQSGIQAGGFSVFIKFWHGWDLRSKFEGSY